MGELILRIFGIKAEGGAGIDSFGFNLLNQGAIYWVLPLGLILAAFVLILYIKDLETVRLRTRLILAGLRIFIILFLLFVFLEPVLVIEQASYNKPYAVVLVDRSVSMSIRDDKGVRITLANNILNDRAAALLSKLENKYQLKLYVFSGEPEELDYQKVRARERLNIEVDNGGFSTAIGVALKKAMDDLTGQPVAGIVLITDGGSNSGDEPVEVAKLAGEKGIPVYPIGVGDSRIKKDVMITNLFSEETVTKGDVVNMTATLEARGYGTLNTFVRVRLKDKILKEERLTITAQGNSGKAEVNLNFLAEETGENDYSVTIPVQNGEISEANNVRAVRIKVTDDKLKVLYVDGYPRWLYRYLIHSLKRDKGVSLSGLLETANPGEFCEGNIPISGFPRTKEQLFEYDVIIIGDVSRNYFAASQLDLIKAFATEKGGGLFFLPGEKWSLAAGRIPELERLFPLELESGAFSSATPVKIGLEPEGRNSPVFLIEDTGRLNEKSWANLEGVYWALKSQKEKPGAVIYAAYKNAKAGTNIFAASQRVGNGKVLLFTSDDVWRWRFKNENKYFYRVFGQCVRWLGPEKAASEDKFVKLTTDKKRYLAGERVFVTARITGKGYAGIKEAEAPAFFTGSDGKREPFTLLRLAKDSTLYTGEFTPVLGGPYKIWLEHPALPVEVKNVKAEIAVEIPNMEYEAPELNEGMLMKIAEVSGGEYFRYSASGGLAEKIIKAKPKVTIRTEKGLKDSVYVIILFIILAAAEWYFRRKKNML